MRDNLHLRKQLEEAKKEVLFLKKWRIFCEMNRLSAYRFIENYNKLSGLRLLVQHLKKFFTL